MPKFKIGERITSIIKGRGFDEAVVLGTFISKDKRTEGREMYLLKIICGTATIPVESEINYKLLKDRRLL